MITPDPNLVETAGQILHARRHRFGTAPICGVCREDAQAVLSTLPVRYVPNLVAEDRTIRDALEVLDLRESPDANPAEWLAMRTHMVAFLRTALSDHARGTCISQVQPGRPCAAIDLANKIIQGEA